MSRHSLGGAVVGIGRRANKSGNVSAKPGQTAIFDGYGPYRTTSSTASAFSLLRKRCREAELSAEETLASMEDLDELTTKPGFTYSETLIAKIINQNVWPPVATSRPSPSSCITSSAALLLAATLAAKANAEDSD